MIIHRISPKFILRLITVALLGNIFRPVDAHAITILNQVQTINFNPTIYDDYNYGGFLKFETKLGTLRAVTLKLNSVSLGGSFIYNQGSSGSSTITAITLDILFYAASNLNNTAHNGLLTDYDVGSLPQTGSVSIANQTLPKTIARRTSATFNFDSSRNLLTEPLVILNLSATQDLGFYQGSGISFAPAFTSMTQFLLTSSFSGSPTRDYSKLTAKVGMSLSYDYLPPAIPEPSYYGLGLSLATLGCCVGRRYAKRKHRPSAV
jgi:hypothetical protein